MLDQPTENKFPWLDAQTPAQMTARYVELRDAKKAYDETQKEIMRLQFSDEMDAIETRLLDFLRRTGSDSISSPGGTAYSYNATSVTLHDPREFQRHVIGTEAWELIEWRAQKSAIAEMADNDQDLPPGVKFSRTPKLGIRRA